MAGQVVGVRALADDDAAASDGVVDTVEKCHVPPVEHGFALNVRLDFARVMWIVAYQDVTLFSGDRRTRSGAGAEAALVIFVPRFYVLVRGQLVAVAPTFSIPVRRDESATHDSVTCHEVASVRGAQEAQPRLTNPRPRREEHVRRQRI